MSVYEFRDRHRSPVFALKLTRASTRMLAANIVAIPIQPYQGITDKYSINDVKPHLLKFAPVTTVFDAATAFIPGISS